MSNESDRGEAGGDGVLLLMTGLTTGEMERWVVGALPRVDVSLVLEGPFGAVLIGVG